MFPSGVGLHVGHPEGYTATDIMARAWRMRGYDVLHPMGWDTFGLPAEQYAIDTVLANEEVVDGKSERGGHPVYRTPLRQRMLKITAYADRLAEDLALVDWREGTVTAQRRWIGRSESADIVFGVDGPPDARIAVFTTRPDILMGATYVALAPEHELRSEGIMARHERAHRRDRGRSASVRRPPAPGTKQSERPARGVSPECR